MAPSPLPPPPPKVIAKKLWNMVKVMFYMLRKGITKTKLLVGLHLTMIKRGKISSKTTVNLMLQHHYAAFASRSHNMSSFPPSEHEYFSCTNSPLTPLYLPKNKHHNNHRENFDGIYNVDEKVFEMLNNYNKVEASPFRLPGFGRTSVVRQVRITDSPFPLKNGEDDDKVDKAAEEFIKKFYKELKKQQIASPPPYHMWA